MNGHVLGGNGAIEAVSIETFVDESLTFQPFTTLITGDLEFPAATFTGPTTRTLLGRLVETNGQGTAAGEDPTGILGTLSTANPTLTINSGIPVVVDFITLGSGPFRFLFAGAFTPSLSFVAGNPAMSITNIGRGGTSITPLTLLASNYRYCIEISLSHGRFFLISPTIYRVAIFDVTAGDTILAQQQELLQLGETRIFEFEGASFIPANHTLELRVTRLNGRFSFIESLGFATFTLELLS